MSLVPSLHNDIESIIGSENALFAADQVAAYAVDGLVPQAVVWPADVDQVSALLALAHRGGLAVTPRGGGTKMALGAPPRRLDLVLSLARLDRVLEYEPADLTVTVEAGLTLGALQEQLSQAGQFLPLDPPFALRATVGGILAANASGPQRFHYGTARDMLLGLRLVQADGTVIQGGGKVVKNVAGYDLPKLFIGSLGTLGVIVEATFKLWPLPRMRHTVAASFSSLDTAMATVLRVMSSVLIPTALEVLNPLAVHHLAQRSEVALPDGDVLLLVEFGGVPEAVARQVRDLEAMAGEESATATAVLGGAEQDRAWAVLRDLVPTLAAGSADGALARISVLPTQVAAVGRRAEELAEEHGLACALVSRAGNGVVYVALSPSLETPGVSETPGVWRGAASSVLHPSSTQGGDSTAGLLAMAIERLRAHVAEREGSLVLEAAPLAVKQHVDVWGPTRSDFPIMQAVKERFDPRGVLNPGRFVGEI